MRPEDMPARLVHPVRADSLESAEITEYDSLGDLAL